MSVLPYWFWPTMVACAIAGAAWVSFWYWYEHH